MNKGRRLFCISLLVFAGLVILGWLAIYPHDPLFRGQPESQWIQNLAYNDDAQVERWRGFGEEGAGVLVRALERTNHPGDRIYRQVYRRVGRILPGDLVRALPTPKMDFTRGIRMNVVALLARLSKDAKPAMPAMIRALRDEDDGVRQLAITYFTQGENADCLLNQLDARARRNLLPDFLRAMEDKNIGVRNNAAIALRFYPEQAELVVPVLTKALQDPDPQVRKLAAQALGGVDPQGKLSLKR